MPQQAGILYRSEIGWRSLCSICPWLWKYAGARNPSRVLTGLCRDMFGACLREEGMVDLVCQEVAGASARAPALSFLAAIARDHGAMPQALRLFR